MKLADKQTYIYYYLVNRVVRNNNVTNIELVEKVIVEDYTWQPKKFERDMVIKHKKQLKGGLRIEIWLCKVSRNDYLKRRSKEIYDYFKNHSCSVDGITLKQVSEHFGINISSISQYISEHLSNTKK